MLRAPLIALLAVPVMVAAQAAPTQPPPQAPPPSAAPPTTTAAPVPPATTVTPATPPPVATPPPQAVAAPSPKPWRLSGSVGVGSSFGDTYFLVGARVGRDLAKGFALEVEGQYWAGQTPAIGKIAPGITWYSRRGPYGGAYYARWLVGSGLEDQNAVGARAGTTIASAGRAVVAAGVAYERVLSCDTDCDSWWPEASVGVRF